MFRYTGKNDQQINRWAILCLSVFWLLFLQISESFHEHGHESEEESGSHLCLLCHISHNAQQAIHGSLAGFELLLFSNELIKAIPVFSFVYYHLAPRSRSPPLLLL